MVPCTLPSPTLCPRRPDTPQPPQEVTPLPPPLLPAARQPLEHMPPTRILDKQDPVVVTLVTIDDLHLTQLPVHLS